MGDFYVDDLFFDHPKVLAAGEDASNLYLRGLAWAHRHNTGHIPKNAVPTFTTKRNPEALAAKLCEVVRGFDDPLWIDRGDTFEIHDWYVRNAKATARRNAGKKGAEAKWRKFHEQQRCDSDAKADADSMRSHKQKPGLPMTNQPRNQGTKEPRTGNALTAQQTANTMPVDNSAAALVAGALNVLVDRRILRSVPPVENVAAYRRVTVAALLAEHAELIGRAADEDVCGVWTAEQLADWLEPAGIPRRPLSEGHGSAYGVRPVCDRCGGSGMFLADGASVAVRCDHGSVAVPDGVVIPL